MFLGNLSTAQERKARKGGGAAKKSKDDDAALDDLIAGFKINDSISVDKKPSTIQKAGNKFRNENLPILYTENTKATDRYGAEIPLGNTSTEDVYNIPRSVVLAYFADVTSLLMCDENIEDIVELSWTSKTPLHQQAMEFQRDVMEFNHQIERDFGCRCLSLIPRTSPNDREIQEAAADFMHSSMRGFVNAIKKRSKRYGGKKRSSGGFERDHIMEFFEGCNALMAMPETKEILRKEFLTTKNRKSPPNEKVIELQRGVLSQLGLDPDYGCSRLNRMSEMFPDDQELAFKMQQFAMCAQVACKEAMMDAEEKTAFYLNIPLFMRNCPHMFLMQQNMMAQQQQMQRQMAGQGAGIRSSEPPTSTSTSTSMAPGVVTSEGPQMMEKMLSDPGSKERLTTLSTRVTGARTRLEPEVAKLTDEEKGQFLESFSNHSVLLEINSAGKDPIERVKKFMALNDDELDLVVKMQIVVAGSVKEGKNLQAMMPVGTDKGEKADIHQNALDAFAMQNFMRGDYGFQEFGSGAGKAYGGSGRGDAVAQGTVKGVHDVASGKVDTMDR